MEFIRHLSGMCGEHHHPNIFNVLAFGSVGFISIYLYARQYIVNFISYIKLKLKELNNE